MPDHYGQQGGAMAPPSPMQQQPPAAPPAGPMEEGAEEATPEEQTGFDMVTSRIGKKIFQDKQANAIVGRIAASQDPADAIAEIATFLTQQEDQSLNNQVPGQIVFGIAGWAAEQVARLAHAKGLVKADQPFMDQVARLLIADVGEAYDVQPQEVEEVIGSLGVPTDQPQQNEGAPPAADATTPPTSNPMQSGQGGALSAPGMMA